ncbi:diaminopimelate decarboxylase [Luteitalea sp. TBR-22]|uniref:hypothetical protein n=1 Tax=Luteitalea sp. TBR-22 TaxID=2802971 RepID=UPI001AF75F24|nr:hypothetical protein [Luteitalea sp. TBR-22]BCS31976.1 diaminopimelate decarboxylase [Luteitalea sp. TBR-22]
MNAQTLPLPVGILRRVAARAGTPAFVYFVDPMRARVRALGEAFAGRFDVSYAIKSNPNVALLRALRGPLAWLDASSAGEIARGIEAGYAPGRIAFSGPAKREVEVAYALDVGCGDIVCESLRQVELVDRLARERGRSQAILLRINPTEVPRRFGLHMGGRPSQFGIDEEQVDDVVAAATRMPGVRLEGLHVYSAGNSLDEDAIADNVAIIADLFARVVDRHALRPSRLVFGSGFGIPYFDEDRELDLQRLAARIVPTVDRLKAVPAVADARLVLEMGRWLVGVDGYMLTSVVDAKSSRGTEIRLCDAGFNNHLSACGMMGTVMRRNWRFWNLSRPDAPPAGPVLLAGPLCASFDVLGTGVHLPVTEPGDVIVVGSSGAYGPTASPTRFISHPAPREILVDEAAGTEDDVTEWTAGSPEPVSAGGR